MSDQEQMYLVFSIILLIPIGYGTIRSIPYILSGKHHIMWKDMPFTFILGNIGWVIVISVIFWHILALIMYIVNLQS